MKHDVAAVSHVYSTGWWDVMLETWRWRGTGGVKHDVAAVSHVYSTGWLLGRDVGSLERERERRDGNCMTTRPFTRLQNMFVGT